MSKRVGQITAPVIARIYADMQALFSPEALEALSPGTPAPQVTLDLPRDEPYPLHVFVWGLPHDFAIEEVLTGMGDVLDVSFHVWTTLIATSSTTEEAARIANEYLGIALQVTLCDTFLGGLAREVMLPQIKEADAWKDEDGKRHAGCLLDYEVRVHFTRSKAAADILERSRENGSNE